MTPSLHISRAPEVDSEIRYGWSLSLDNVEPIDEGRESSVTECLSAAAGNFESSCADWPKSLVIHYRGMDLGTFPLQRLENATAAVADEMMERFSAVKGFA